MTAHRLMTERVSEFGAYMHAVTLAERRERIELRNTLALPNWSVSYLCDYTGKILGAIHA